ncbi:SDR family oxidoreductase [Tumebacillus sp. DT12]|uniref:SDR family oxidoreductase n=1 Tax=Tumebacillus lacus TaxID=2995335 RepID=A0ABT3WY70_9BACL|nr:SDR family oxidoreductase [Tumebacillus lacus]MCX7569619.1 SDR family oxidoreductase [Tumebacillus lacus]
MTPRQTALITGASNGIGLELAKLFARDGHDLVLVARSEDKLRELAADMERTHGISVLVIAKDLSDPAAPAEVYEQVQAAGIRVDVLVNNAGYGSFGLFAETDLDFELNMIRLNIESLTHLSKRYVRDMIAQKSGRILNVASTASFQPGPLMAVYYASKAYVLSFSEALANELTGTGVTVTALCPGATASGFQEMANMQNSKLVQGAIMDAKTVAEIGYRGLLEGRTVVIPGLTNKVMATSTRFMPRKLVTKIVRTIQSERQVK